MRRKRDQHKQNPEIEDSINNEEEHSASDLKIMRVSFILLSIWPASPRQCWTTDTLYLQSVHSRNTDCGSTDIAGAAGCYCCLLGRFIFDYYHSVS
jgi:hypothetical protein